MTVTQPLRRIGLLSIPARHPYVEAVTPHEAVGVSAARVSGFAPDPALDADQLPRLAAGADLVHLHFGYDHLDSARLQAWVDQLRALRLPLVLTVHDLRNPHHREPGKHHRALRILTAAAREVLTLTAGAAAEIAARYGRTARVVAHPTLVDPRRTAEVDTVTGSVVLHLKSLRTNLLDPVELAVAAAHGAVRGGGRLRVDVHPDVMTDPRLAGLEAELTRVDAELSVHARFDDLELEEYLRRAHVTVVPHRWGTHSGWLEMARDLGTAVVVPRNGYYHQQWPAVHGYDNDETHGLDAESLSAAVASALQRPAPPPAARSARLAQADAVRSEHGRIYLAALTETAES